MLADAPSERAAAESDIKADDRLAEAAGVNPEVGRAVEAQESRALGRTAPSYFGVLLKGLPQ
jgi:hypothetical protein